MKKKAISIMIFFTLVLTGVVSVPITGIANTIPFIDKYMSESEGELGDIITITIDIEIPDGLSNIWVSDFLPWGFEYVEGSYMIDGSFETPYWNDDDLIYDDFTVPGTYQITFDAKIVKANPQEEIEVINTASIYWEYDGLLSYSEDNELFTILPCELVHKNVGIAKADVVFAIDLTGSMNNEIDIIRTEATNIMNDVAGQITDVQFGLISFMDYVDAYTTTEPGSVPETYSENYGYAAFGDYPYNLDQDITDDISIMSTTINSLDIGHGGDGPQDYSRIIHESWNDPDLHWRSDATKFLILFGDNVPHDTNFDIDDDGTPDNTGGDPGRDTILGNTDDLDFETEVANAAANGVHIFGVYSGLTTSKYPWTYMSDETDGGYYELTETEELPEAILDLIKAEVEETLTITEKTEVLWPVFINVENPYDFPMEDTRIYDRFGGEIQINYIKAGNTIYEFKYSNYNKKNAEVEIFKDDISIGTYDLDKDGVSLGAEPYEFYIYWIGKSHKIHFEWTIGTLPSGEFIGIIIGASTDTNPAGKQEYTSPGIYELNSGATLKFYDSSTQFSACTDSIYITVLPK